MGQVYRATDTKLKRQVAIKILPPSVAADHDRLARFQREAEVLASLNHPNIAGIYGLEESGGATALVMELVEGEDLSATIARGPIPVAEALPMAQQIAEALEAAHEHGIVHRDLKPANIKVREDGTVKILDFGLAKAIDAGAASGLSDDFSASTLTAQETEMGAILGTVAYMAPEQARGKTVDRRADIWSFGVVLYEMLAGRRLFAGPTLSDTLAAVLKTEPDLARVPVQARRIVERCLRKDPRQRWQAIGDVRIAIEESLAGETAEPASVPPRRNVLRWAMFLLALAVAGVLAIVGVMSFREMPAESRVFRFTIAPPANGRFGIPSNDGLHLAVSPDGSRIVFAAIGNDGNVQLWIRSLDSTIPRPLAGTENARLPVLEARRKVGSGFSPAANSGRLIWLAAPPCLWRMRPKGAAGPGMAPARSCSAPGKRAAVQSCRRRRRCERGDDTGCQIGRGGPMVALVPARRKAFPVCNGRRRGSHPTIRIGSLESPDNSRVLQDADSSAVYAKGHLLFLRGTTLMARPFDATTLEFTAEAFPAAERVRLRGSRAGGNAFSVSSTGVLVYVGAAEDDSRLTWFDRKGKRLRTMGNPGNLGRMDLSPDDKTVAVVIFDRGNTDIATCGVARGLCERFTSNPAPDDSPVWSSDSNMIVFRSIRNGLIRLFRKPADGSGVEEEILADVSNTWPNSLAPDGRLAYVITGAPKTSSDIWFLRPPLAGTGEPIPSVVLNSEYAEQHVQFSPDGKWLAYEYNESGRYEIYVAASTGQGRKQRVSESGGVLPRWRQDGRELFYIAPDQRLMSAAIEPADKTVSIGAIEPLFGGLIVGRGFLYDVSRDGQRVVGVVPPEGQPEEPLTVVTNFTAGLKR